MFCTYRDCPVCRKIREEAEMAKKSTKTLYDGYTKGQLIDAVIKRDKDIENLKKRTLDDFQADSLPRH
jgi:hypothetical protein